MAAASIDTGNTRRDTHLRSADFFDVANHPDITFTATRVRPAGQGVLVTGTLSVRDRTRPLSFEAAAAVPGHGEIRLDAEVRINRADFGLTWNRLGLVAMNSTAHHPRRVPPAVTRQHGDRSCGRRAGLGGGRVSGARAGAICRCAR